MEKEPRINAPQDRGDLRGGTPLILQAEKHMVKLARRKAGWAGSKATWSDREGRRRGPEVRQGAAGVSSTQAWLGQALVSSNPAEPCLQGPCGF